MALRIVADQCINCDACLSECPNDAIIQQKGTYFIEWEKCTECVGFYDKPQCTAVCPVDDCCIPDPGHAETQDELKTKKKRLHTVT
jgi:ferredoxin